MMPQFMSPEIALGMSFGLAADIFSYGILLAEVITGREPSNDAGREFLKRTARNQFCLDEEELRENILEGCPEELQVMALQCCDGESDYRPSASQCVEILEVLFCV